MRIVWSSAGLILIAAACVPGSNNGPTTAVVTDRMRGACPDVSEIDREAMVVRIDADRLAGVTKRKEILDLTAECADDVCVTCATIAVEEVYAQ